MDLVVMLDAAVRIMAILIGGVELSLASPTGLSELQAPARRTGAIRQPGMIQTCYCGAVKAVLHLC